MDHHLKEELFNLYDLDETSSMKLLNSGENDTYLIQLKEEKFILRKYRVNRYTDEQIKAEMDWIKVLKEDFLVPHVIHNRNEEDVTTIINQELEHHFVVFKYINASEVEMPNKEDYQKLGLLMKSLHHKTSHILKSLPANWVGFKRPTFDEEFTLQQSLQNLKNASFLSNAVKSKSSKIAEKIQKFIPELGDLQFVHGDMHFGNILTYQDKWYLLDFDESGFGYKAFDIAVPRMHMLATNQLENYWLSFKEGYHSKLSETEIRGGTALRLFYMAGKIPHRLDIEEISKNPSRFIERYLGLVEEELSGDTLI